MPEFFQQTLEPARVAAGLDPHPHPLALQAAVKSLGLTRGMHQLPSHSFLALQIQQRDLLEAGMEITAYNLHHGSFRTESLVLSRLKITRRASEPSLLSNHRSAQRAGGTLRNPDIGCAGARSAGTCKLHYDPLTPPDNPLRKTSTPGRNSDTRPRRTRVLPHALGRAQPRGLVPPVVSDQARPTNRRPPQFVRVDPGMKGGPEIICRRREW